MAVLGDSTRVTIWALFMRALSDLRENNGGLTKAELRAAVNATDTWIDDNAGSFNTALPTAARTALSANQKARLFMAVAEKRFGVS